MAATEDITLCACIMFNVKIGSRQLLTIHDVLSFLVAFLLHGIAFHFGMIHTFTQTGGFLYSRNGWHAWYDWL